LATKVTVSTCAFSAAFLLTCRSRNRRASFPFGSQQQANEVLRHDLPKSHLIDYDIWAGLFFLSMRFDRLEQPLRRQTSSTAFQFQHDACEGFRQPAFADP